MTGAAAVRAQCPGFLIFLSLCYGTFSPLFGIQIGARCLPWCKIHTIQHPYATLPRNNPLQTSLKIETMRMERSLHRFRDERPLAAASRPSPGARSTGMTNPLRLVRRLCTVALAACARCSFARNRECPNNGCVLCSYEHRNDPVRCGKPRNVPRTERHHRGDGTTCTNTTCALTPSSARAASALPPGQSSAS